MDDMVSVEITYTERVRLTHIVKMTRAEFEKYDACIDRNAEAVVQEIVAAKVAKPYDDFQDADFDDLFTFEIVEV